MKRFRTLSLAAAALVATVFLQGTSSSQGAAASYKIDGEHAHVVFRISHLGYSYTYGRFNKIGGAFKFSPGDASQNHVKLEIVTESVDTQVAKRDGHLRSPDFFSAKEFPKITFESTSWKAAGDKAFDVAGKLSLHGVTKEITIRVDFVGEGKDPWGNYRTGFESVFTIKRSEYGMKKMLPAIGDEIRLMISLEGIKQ